MATTDAVDSSAKTREWSPLNNVKYSMKLGPSYTVTTCLSLCGRSAKSLYLNRVKSSTLQSPGMTANETVPDASSGTVCGAPVLAPRRTNS
jgi:hypothetical protein